MGRLAGLGRRVALLGAAGGLALGAFAPAAHAAETATWGIVAAPGSSGFRSSLSHAADGGTVHDAVLVWNRTGTPLTVDLSVMGATYRGGAYQFSGPHSGLAAGVSLAASQIRLGPHQEARVPVTIHEPRGVKQTDLAGIAAEAAPIQDGALQIEERLVVLVKATPTSNLLPVPAADVTVAGAIAAVLLAAVVAALAFRRRLAAPGVP